MIRVRPSQPTRHNFDEILPTLNSSRESVYFVPQNAVFALDMRVFVTFPYDTAWFPQSGIPRPGYPRR